MGDFKVIGPITADKRLHVSNKIGKALFCMSSAG